MKMRLLATMCAAALTFTVAAAVQPQYGAWGYDRAGADSATQPGDDFFRHANGAWLEQTQIPADKTGVSLRLAMTDAVEARLHEMMEQAAAKTAHEPADLESKVGAFYKAFMDEKHVEALAEALRRRPDGDTRGENAR